MKVEVERTLTGFRLTMPCGSREHIRYRDEKGSWWCRAYAREALDLLVALYGARRERVRFKH